MSINPELQEELSSTQAPTPVPQSRLLILFRLVIIVGSLGFGGMLMWLSLKNDPMNPPGLSPFIAFAIAVVIMTYDDMTDQPGRILKKAFSKKVKHSPKKEPVSAIGESSLTKSQINFDQEEAESRTSIKEAAGEGMSNENILRQLLELKEENKSLKMMYAKLSMEIQALKDHQTPDDEAGQGTESRDNSTDESSEKFD